MTTRLSKSGLKPSDIMTRYVPAWYDRIRELQK